ncbi:hypothetical protein [Pseudogracilibacillus auburnensis]|uniref:hypothetical protein n=1 Tax=Pseudogracilibacillus auburnensis TaxID=1494959 RepID=UPI001A9633AB|nr:hypothetical protein [Pseudogracilibacillus auburnensis]MBO1005949.1 hypothetical protein [Pseudogracilibacillus auburnensis]
MGSVYSSREKVSNIDIKAFVKGDPSPFKSLDFSTYQVYELTDYTLRTPLEKMDVFNELLELKHDCELWILPITEETTSLLKEFPKDETYETTASLFTLLSSFKEKVERDRTFVVAPINEIDELVDAFKALGFTMKEMDSEKLLSIELDELE